MKKLIYLLFTCLFMTKLISQNLVPNYSFEVHSNCPNGTSGISLHFATSWDGWDSSDYFSYCATDSQYSVPQNIVGYQQARTDTSYAGILLHVPTTTPVSSEFIQVQLTDSLIKSHYYCVSFYVSLADSSKYAINNVGAFFSENVITLAEIESNGFIPQIENPADSMLNDKVNWKEISSYYYANGGEKFLTIGNFYTNANTVSQHVGGATSPFFDVAYYYIDDVSVVQCDSLFNSVNDISQPYTRAIRLYPNPSDGNMTLEYQLSESENGILAIYDLSGKQVLTHTLNNGNKTIINTYELNAGVYMYEILIDNRKMKMDKLVIFK